MAKKQDIIEAAKTLPPEERAEVAHALWESLEPFPADDPAEVAAEWETELARRSEDLRSGRVQGIDADEALARLRQRAEERDKKR